MCDDGLHSISDIIFKERFITTFKYCIVKITDVNNIDQVGKRTLTTLSVTQVTSHLRNRVIVQYRLHT